MDSLRAALAHQEVEVLLAERSLCKRRVETASANLESARADLNRVNTSIEKRGGPCDEDAPPKCAIDAYFKAVAKRAVQWEEMTTVIGAIKVAALDVAEKERARLASDWERACDRVAEIERGFAGRGLPLAPSSTQGDDMSFYDLRSEAEALAPRVGLRVPDTSSSYKILIALVEALRALRQISSGSARTSGGDR